MACSASLVRSAPPRDDENEQGEHRRRRPRGSRRCAPRVAPVPPFSPPRRSARPRAPTPGRETRPRAHPPEPTAHPAPPLVAAHPAGELRAVLRTLWSGEYAAFPVRAQPPTARDAPPLPTTPPPPHRRTSPRPTFPLDDARDSLSVRPRAHSHPSHASRRYSSPHISALPTAARRVDPGALLRGQPAAGCARVHPVSPRAAARGVCSRRRTRRRE